MRDPLIHLDPQPIHVLLLVFGVFTILFSSSGRFLKVCRARGLVSTHNNAPDSLSKSEDQGISCNLPHDCRKYLFLPSGTPSQPSSCALPANARSPAAAFESPKHVPCPRCPRSFLPQERLSLTEPLLATFLGVFCTGVGVLPRLDPSRHEVTRGVLLELTRLTIVIQVGLCTRTWLSCWTMLLIFVLVGGVWDTRTVRRTRA